MVSCALLRRAKQCTDLLSRCFYCGPAGGDLGRSFQL